MANLWYIRNSASRLVERIELETDLPVPCLPEEEVQRLKHPIDLDILCEALTARSTEHSQNHINVVWAEACLRNPHGILQSSGTDQSARKLLTWVTELIFPKGCLKLPNAYMQCLDIPKPELCTEKNKLQALAALRLTSELYRLFSALKYNSQVNIIACYASFTNDNDPWTTQESKNIAMSLLELHQQSWQEKDSSRIEGVIPRLLDEIIRPLFSDHRSSSVTAHGRGRREFTAISPDPSVSILASKPWKVQSHAITILRWIFSQLNTQDIEDLLALVIPPVLALLDDDDLPYNVKGCELLAVLLENMPTELLQRTGLGNVFEESLIPYLSYLPPLTAERNSLDLLRAAYGTLFKLSAIRFPGSVEDAKYAAYDRIMRRGILYGHAHAGDHVKLIDLFLGQLTLLVDLMGIRCVKHLKSIIPILNKHISDPFALSYMPLLNSSIKAMQIVILNAWPRMHHYSSDIFEALSVCWSRLSDENSNSPEQMDLIRNRVKETTKILVASLVNAPSAVAHINQAYERKPRLKGMKT